MEFYEEAVMKYLTADFDTFVIPQFAIKDDSGKKEWSCPDFVAIKPGEKKCCVVEVSTAFNLTNLAKKVLKKEYQWLDKLKRQLKGITDESWSYEVWVFIRKDREEWFKQKVPGVTVKTIEKTLVPWEWTDR